MQELPPDTVRDRSRHPGGRLLNLRRWLRERRRAGDDGSAFAFGVRLLATVILTFALVGAIGYILLDRNLSHRQMADYAAAQRADADAFEGVGSREANPTDAILDIDRLLQGVSQRPGILEGILVDRQHTIRAAAGVTGNPALVGTVNVDPKISAVLEHGISYAGVETDPAQDSRDIEFVIPVSLFGARYAYETTYDHTAYQARLHEVRTILALIGLVGLIGGGIVFYLVGGRRLMRDHRTVLRRATRDGLTDLPNQRAFQDEFPQAVSAAMRYHEPLALALLDVDDFKLINDRHGHPHGDAILKRVAAVLRNARPGDRPYRTGGDEFALLLAHTDGAGTRAVARRLCRDLADSGIEVSIGISALRPGLQAETLRSEADAALYEAKRHGGNRTAHFDEIRERVVVITAEKKDAVRRLIDEGRFETVFQPIWNLDSGTLLGLEALTRPDSSCRLSGPAEAFDVAEQLGRVHQLDVLCVENALRFASELEPGLLMFINLSPQTLDLDLEANAWLAPAVDRVGLSPRDVVVEVTERFGGRTESVVKRLECLHRQGFKIALDDVGTGNSGLEMLSKINAEFVKIDRSIVAGAVAREPTAHAILMAMVTFACQTGAFVIAEGVEDADTLQFLRALNDEHEISSGTIIQGGQGFGLGRPSSELLPPTPKLLKGDHSRARQPRDARRTFA
jgi:diguanylate cyclase (GGDEF)-like protein